MYQDRVIRFGEISGDQVKGRLQKKLKTLIIVLCVLHAKVHVLSFIMIIISSAYRVSSPCYPLILGKILGDQVKGRSPKKLKSLIEVPNVVHVKVHVLASI